MGLDGCQALFDPLVALWEKPRSALGKMVATPPYFRLWIGLQRHLHHDDQTYREHCLSLAKELNLPITACGGVLMHHSERLPLQHTLTAIRQGCAVEELGADRLTNAERSLRDAGNCKNFSKPNG